MRPTSPVLDRFLAKVEGVRPNGTGFKFRCPAHEDDRQSGHASLGTDGKVILHCFAGCPPEAILERTGLTFADLRPPDAKPTAAQGDRYELTAYPYADEDRQLLYQSLRKQYATHKDFLQRRRKEGGGWTYKLGDVRRVIYRLPDVLDAIAAGKPILYLEGERDVDRAWALGVPATTHAGGAKAFRSEYANQLAGGDVVLLADNDAAGYGMMRTAYQALRPKANSVHVLQLVGMPEKADFSDYADVVGDAEASDLHVFGETDTPPVGKPYLRFITPQMLTDLAGVSAETAPEAEALTGPELVWSRFSDIEEEPVEWIWQDRLAANKLHLLCGVQGDGKSTVECAIAGRLSSGKPLPDGAVVTPRRIGLLISEDGLGDTVRPRLRIHGADLDNIFAIEAVRTGNGDQPLSLNVHLPLLEQFIGEQQIDVLFIDSLSDFLGMTEQNDNAKVRQVLIPLAHLAARARCAIVGIVHLGKPGVSARRAVERVLGSGAFTQVARIVWAVSVDPDDETRRYFGVVKSNLAPEPPTLAWHRDRDMPISWDGQADSTVKAMMSGAHQKVSKVDQAKTFLAEFLKDGPRPRTLIIQQGADRGIGKNSLYAASDELGVIKSKEASFGGIWHWELPKDTDDDQ